MGRIARERLDASQSENLSVSSIGGPYPCSAVCVQDGIVDLGDYYNLSLEKQTHTVTEEEVLSYVDTYCNGEDITSYAKTLGYENKSEFLTELKAQIQKNYDMDYLSQARINAIDAVVANSKFYSISEEQLKKYIDDTMDIYEEYKTFFHTDDIEDIYKLYKTSEEQIKEDCKQQLLRDMVIKAITAKNGIYISGKDYKNALEELSFLNYESIEAIQSEYTSAEIQYVALSNKVADFILDNADICYVEK